jgi:acyl-CoA synthetase (AMP-forming)/AMP-acid ligase II
VPLPSRAVTRGSNPETTVDLLESAADRLAGRDAFVDGTDRLSFEELSVSAAGAAGGLSRLGLGPGDVLVLVLPSSVDYAVCYHAAMRLGAVTSGINPRLGPAEVAGILRRVRPVVTVAPARWRPTSASGIGAGRVVDVAEVRTWWHGAPAPRALLSCSTPVAVVWTSGTTGAPKGAVYNHSNLAEVAKGAGDLSRPGDRRLSPLPFAHVGFMTKAWDELVNGITTVVTPTPWKAGDAIALMERERVTVGQGVPAQWRLVLDHPDLAGADLSSLRVVGTGASSVPPALVRELRLCQHGDGDHHPLRARRL